MQTQADWHQPAREALKLECRSNVDALRPDVMRWDVNQLRDNIRNATLPRAERFKTRAPAAPRHGNYRKAYQPVVHHCSGRTVHDAKTGAQLRGIGIITPSIPTGSTVVTSECCSPLLWLPMVRVLPQVKPQASPRGRDDPVSNGSVHICPLTRRYRRSGAHIRSPGHEAQSCCWPERCQLLRRSTRNHRVWRFTLQYMLQMHQRHDRSGQCLRSCRRAVAAKGDCPLTLLAIATLALQPATKLGIVMLSD